jgi:hypothetical protein
VTAISVEEGEEDEEHEFESSEDVLDAIVALDDLHRAKNISMRHIRNAARN